MSNMAGEKLFFGIIILLLASLFMAQFVKVQASSTYYVFVAAYDNAESTVAVVEMDIDYGFYETTPFTYSDDYGNMHILSANATDAYGNYFQYWNIEGYHYPEINLYIGEWFDYQVVTAIYDVGETPPSGEGSTGNYTLYGPFDEDSGVWLNETVLVTAYYTQSGMSPMRFYLNGQYGFNMTVKPQYFRFTFSDNSTREYWMDPSESTTQIYVFKSDTIPYTINFFDTTGILSRYPYITIKRYVNGTLFTVEKRKVDSYKSILANLVYTRTYQIILGNELTTYVFGDLTMTSQTGIQLVLRGVDFPEETLFLQKYVRVYGLRNDTVITIYYEDTKLVTTSVDITINSGNLAEVYSTTIYSNSFTLEWNEALHNIDYQVTVVIHHGTYGDLTWKQYFIGGNTEPPFSLAFLGDWNFDSTFLIPALLILCVAGSFSKLNAEVGAILMVITAIILTSMGWIPIPAGMLVTAMVLAILMGLMYAKRRVTIY